MIQTKWFEGDSNIQDCIAIRTKVFIEEQGVAPELEIDGSDKCATHLVVYDSNLPVATGRLIVENGQHVLGRIAVLKELRGKGLGDLVVRMLIRKAYDMGVQKQYVHAQIQALGFYEKLGFKAYGDEYLDAGIPHVSMVHEGDVGGACQ